MLRHGHPRRSCIHNDDFHMVFNRELDAEEWAKIGRLVELDPKAWDPVTKKWKADGVERAVRIGLPSITCELWDPVPA